jgi:hypothetical protein
MLRNSSPTGLGRALGGRRFASARRHGKLLVCPTDGPALLLHFGMTGTFVWSGDDHRHDRLVLELDDGDLHYRNMRRLGGIWLAKSDRELVRSRAAWAPTGRSGRRASIRGAPSPRSTRASATCSTGRSRRCSATRCPTGWYQASGPGSPERETGATPRARAAAQASPPKDRRPNHRVLPRRTDLTRAGWPPRREAAGSWSRFYCTRRATSRTAIRSRVG